MKATPTQRRELGSQRAAVSHLIRHELSQRGHTGISVAASLKCSCTNVYDTMAGKKHSYKVLDELRSLGVPEELLFDPRMAVPEFSSPYKAMSKNEQVNRG